VRVRRVLLPARQQHGERRGGGGVSPCSAASALIVSQQGHRSAWWHADGGHAAGNKDCHGRDHLASGVSAWTCPGGMAQDSAVRPASLGWLTSPSPPAAGGAATPRCRHRSPRAHRAPPESVLDTNGSSPSRSLTSWKATLRGASGRTGRRAQQAAPPTAPRAFSASAKRRYA
jgi:hypothetical protein